MRAALLAIVLGLACAAVAAAGPAPAKIVFHEQAQVLGDEMRLGELATLSGSATQLADIPMGRSPEPGRALVLKRAEVLGKLSVAVPEGAAEVSCPEAVTAVRSHQTVSRDQMLKALQAQLERRLLAGGSAGKVLVSGFRVAEEPMVPEGKLALLFDLPETNDRLLGNVSLPLIIKVNGVVARKLRTAAQVSLKCQVVCAARELRRHEVVGADDVRLETREVSDLEPAHSLEEVVGKRAASTIEAGAVVARRDVEEPPVLSRGGAVTILLESGPLMITTRGTASQGGRVGDTVRVVNSDSKREVVAVIVDHNTVRVPFER